MLQRALERVASAAEARPTPAEVDATLERAREQLESLAAATAELQSGLPEAIQGGLKEHFRPSARHLAEVRGLMNQTIRRLERLETEVLAERNARVDDLAVLVDLISSGWRGVDEKLGQLAERLERIDDRVEQFAGVDERMARIENAFARLEKALTDRTGAVVYRIEERRTS